MNARRRSDCPIAFGLDHFGDRWSLLVLRDLIFVGKSRFQEFLASDERISTNILAERLNQLAKAGLIRKDADTGDKRRFSYTPTSKALDLVPVLLEIVRWSARHDPGTGAPAEFVRQIARDRDAVAAAVRAAFESPARLRPASFAPPDGAPRRKPRGGRSR